MSIVGPGGAKTTAAPKQAQSQPAGASKPTPRPVAGTNGVTPAPQLKRKASGPADNSQVKVQRKDSPAQPVQYTGTARPTATHGATRPNQATTTTVPYRGTAAPSSSKPANPVVKKPTAPASTAAAVQRKATPPASKPVTKPASAATPSTTAAPASKPKGYLALLQKAKEKDLTKPAAPPVIVAPKGFIPTKKERLALKAEANAAKGKKAGVISTAKTAEVKGDAAKVQRKPADVGYQGTARPAKTAAPIGYKGTARPQSTTAPSSRGGTPAAKPKPKPEKGRYDGYADWSDLDEMEDDGEEEYASDGSSDMEGGMWDVEEEEQLALKAAKKEDAEALAEEMRLKREKEEKKRKLLALSKAAAAKKKY